MSAPAFAKSLARLRVALRELEAYRDLATAPLGAAAVRGPNGDAGSLSVGEHWPDAGFPLVFTFEGQVPEVGRLAGDNAASANDTEAAPAAHGGAAPDGGGRAGPLLRLDVGGEALASVNGARLGGVNPYHRELALPSTLVPGTPVTVRVEAVPHGLFGTPTPEPALREACWVWPDALVRALHEDLAAAVDAAEVLADARPEVAELLARATADTVAELRLPRADTERFLARLTRVEEDRRVQAGVWEAWRFAGEASVLDEAARHRLQVARAALRERLEAVRERYPSDGELVLSGHAHIDLAWLWPLAETRRKAVRTFRTALALMDGYPGWTFNQSTAQLYQWLQEDDPDGLEAIRRRVAEGRWEIVGGMWVEPDGNLLAGESWARQLLYGQLGLERLTGDRATVAWLPDTFGYAGNLPQLFRQAGMPHFFTTKLNWNETDRFPHDLFWWEGIDGTRVLAHGFHNPRHAYNGVVQAGDTTVVWNAFRGKRYHRASLFTFGWGDGGGGPTAEMLERFERQRAMPGLPALRHGRVDAYFEAVERSGAAPRLPVWVGEMYLEFHRGTYTTQARVKALHRRLEHELVEAEAAATLRWRLLAAPYPEERLRDLWQTLLRNEFHDILPGSGIRAVAAESEEELGAASAAARALRDEALNALAAAIAGGPGVVVWNLSLHDRPLRTALRGGGAGGGAAEVLRAAGARVQEVDGALYVDAPELVVPGLGYLALPGPGSAVAEAGRGAAGAEAAEAEEAEARRPKARRPKAGRPKARRPEAGRPGRPRRETAPRPTVAASRTSTCG